MLIPGLRCLRLDRIGIDVLGQRSDRRGPTRRTPLGANLRRAHATSVRFFAKTSHRHRCGVSAGSTRARRSRRTRWIFFAGVGLGYHFTDTLAASVDSSHASKDVGDENETGEGDITSFHRRPLVHLRGLKQRQVSARGAWMRRVIRTSGDTDRQRIEPVSMPASTESPRTSGPHSRRCAGVNEVAGRDLEQRRQLRDDLRHLPGHLGDIRVLLHLAVHPEPDAGAFEECRPRPAGRIAPIGADRSNPLLVSHGAPVVTSRPIAGRAA